MTRGPIIRPLDRSSIRFGAALIQILVRNLPKQRLGIAGKKSANIVFETYQQAKDISQQGRAERKCKYRPDARGVCVPRFTL